MDKMTNGMTNDQKQAYYVNKISLLSDSEYKNKVGFWASLGAFAIGLGGGLLNNNFIFNDPQILEGFIIGAGAVCAYCGIAWQTSQSLGTKASEELGRINEQVGRKKG